MKRATESEKASAIEKLRGMIKEGQTVYYHREGLTDLYRYCIGGVDNKGLPGVADITNPIAYATNHGVKATKHFCGADYGYPAQMVMKLSEVIFGDPYKLNYWEL